MTSLGPDFYGGKTWEITPKCKRTIKWDNGTTITADPDGKITGELASGHKFEVRTDCTIIIDFPNPPPDGTTLRLNPDGSQTTRTDHASTSTDGTTTTNPDGSSTTSYPDGTTVEKIPPPREMKHIKFPKGYGLKTVLKINGSLAQVRFEGTTTINYEPLQGEKSMVLWPLLITKKKDGTIEVDEYTLD